MKIMKKTAVIIGDDLNGLKKIWLKYGLCSGTPIKEFHEKGFRFYGNDLCVNLDNSEPADYCSSEWYIKKGYDIITLENALSQQTRFVVKIGNDLESLKKIVEYNGLIPNVDIETFYKKAFKDYGKELCISWLSDKKRVGYGPEQYYDNKQRVITAKEFFELSDIKEMKYAAIVEDSYYVEGDERSRTNPGHGYPGHTVNYSKFIEFKDEEEMKKWIISNESSALNKKKYKIIRYENLKVSLKTSIEVDVH